MTLDQSWRLLRSDRQRQLRLMTLLVFLMALPWIAETVGTGTALVLLIAWLIYRDEVDAVL